jgi:hypothetical protein
VRVKQNHILTLGAQLLHDVQILDGDQLADTLSRTPPATPYSSASRIM